MPKNPYDWKDRPVRSAAAYATGTAMPSKKKKKPSKGGRLFGGYGQARQLDKVGS